MDGLVSCIPWPWPIFGGGGAETVEMGTLSSSRQRDVEKLQIVAFDFDGTLTVTDSYTAFLFWSAGPFGRLARLAGLIPDAIRYVADGDRGQLKAAAARAFLGRKPVNQLAEETERFVEERFDSLLRPDALACWRRWGEAGARRVIVTASPELVVAPFARRLGADSLIATVLEADEAGLITGRLATPNCRGPEKVVRLIAAFGPDIELAAAYGDTGGDTEMLAFAGEGHYRVFTGKP